MRIDTLSDAIAVLNQLATTRDAPLDADKAAWSAFDDWAARNPNYRDRVLRLTQHLTSHTIHARVRLAFSRGTTNAVSKS